MKLTTKCPKCSTVFDVSLQELQQRKGYARCVSCAYIFDGFEAVVADDLDIKPTVQPPPKVVPTIEPVTKAQYASVTDSIVRTRTQSDNKPPLDLKHKISDLDNVVADDFTEKFIISNVTVNKDKQPHFFDEDIEQEPIDHIVNDNEFIFEGIKDSFSNDYHDETEYDKDNEVYVNVTSRIMSVLWVCLIAIGVAVFLLQLAYVFRVQIAENMPQFRPRLQQLCVAFGCDLPWSRKPDHILIVHSSLQSKVASIAQNTENGNVDLASNAEQDSEYVLHVVLRNTYNQAQEWPTIVLELTDAAGAKIARKNIMPQQYLTIDYLDKPFKASSEYQMQLPIKLQGLKVNGYQVTTFFP